MQFFSSLLLLSPSCGQISSLVACSEAPHYAVFLQSSVTFSLLWPNIFLSTLFWSSSLCSFSPVFCYFLPLVAKYLPNHPVLEHLHSLFPYCTRPCFTLSQTTGTIIILCILTSEMTSTKSTWSNEFYLVILCPLRLILRAALYLKAYIHFYKILVLLYEYYPLFF